MAKGKGGGAKPSKPGNVFGIKPVGQGNNNKNRGGGGGQNKPSQPRISASPFVPNTGQKIRRDIGRKDTINFTRANRIAERHGVDVNRVFKIAEKSGTQGKLGAAAAEAGYVDPLKRLDKSEGYKEARQDYFAQQEAALAQPEFDWEDWDAQMMEKQAAVWESMDAMNSAFLDTQDQWQQAQQEGDPNAPWIRPTGWGSGNAGNADPAQIKRLKKKKRNASTITGPLSIGGQTNNGTVSTGGASAGKTLGLS